MTAPHTEYKPTRDIVTYFISRDSLDGVVTDECDLWWVRPLRTRVGERVTWVAGAGPETGHLGKCTLVEVTYWFRTYPDSDRQLLKAEQYKVDKKKNTSKPAAKK